MTTSHSASFRRRQAVKRAGDVFGSALLIVALAPVLVGTASVVRLKDGAPVFFRQQRPGLDEQPFIMLKFRTMRAPTVGEDIWTSDARRVSRVGGFLRRTSLDELPELINVLRGDMSLVGPRPLLMDYLPKYTTDQRRRHAMKPGVTGLAQVRGRRALSFSQRLALDIEYVDNWSLALDMKILLMTLAEPFRRGPGEDQALDEVDDLGFFERTHEHA